MTIGWTEELWGKTLRQGVTLKSCMDYGVYKMAAERERCAKIVERMAEECFRVAGSPCGRCADARLGEAAELIRSGKTLEEAERIIGRRDLG